jgi:hypothetical protein
MNTTTQEKTIKELFIGKCWEYLNDNFYKFTDTNKIKVALELCKKDLPTQLDAKGLEDIVKVYIQNNAPNIQDRKEQSGNERVDLTSQARTSFSEPK